VERGAKDGGDPTATWLLLLSATAVLLAGAAAANVFYALWAARALALWLAGDLLAGNEPAGMALVVPGGAERRRGGTPP